MTRHGTSSDTQSDSAIRHLIPGRATAEGTDRFSTRFRDSLAPDFFRDFVSSLSVSSLGMGTYLGDCNDEVDECYTRTICAGFDRALNLVDTSVNYRCQRSERAAGKAIAATIASGSATRDELVICTKGGFVPLDGSPPKAREDYDSYLKTEYFDRGIMSRSDLVAGGHCLTPGFLANQVERSRSNLGVECIDVYYLHNPEQQLDVLDRARFLEVMRKAFAELEKQVAEGRIAAYGCATWNGFRVFAANRNYLSLVELLSAATDAGGKDHNFRAIQLPVNLAMTEAVRAPTQSSQGRNIDILTLAGEHGISVIASASLMQAQLTRDLPDTVRSMFPALDTDAQRAIAFVRSLPVACALAGMKSAEHLEENLLAGAGVIKT